MSAPVHIRPWHKQKVSSGADAALFFLVFIGGIAGVFWLKQEGYNQIIVTAVPGLLLMLYAAIVGFVPRFRLRSDQAGDNCYYLGFLFTLLSLSLALTAFAKAGGTEKIVEDFGIALASTIIGLALRVAFNQMRQVLVEIEREARLELSAAAQRLRSELDQSVVEMNVFRRATQQSIVDGLEELNAKVGDLLEKNLAHYDQVTSGSAESIDRTLAVFVENAQSLNSVTEKIADAIEALTVRIDAINAPKNLVETTLAPATTAVAKIVTELTQLAGAESEEFRQLRKMIEGAISAAAGLEGQVTPIAEMLKGLKQLGNTLDAAERRFGAFTMALDKAGKAFASTGEELHHALSEPAREASIALIAIASQAESLREIEMRMKRLPVLLENQIAVLSRKRGKTIDAPWFFPFRRRR